MSHYHQPGVGLTIPAIIGQGEAFTGVFRRIPGLGLRLTRHLRRFPCRRRSQTTNRRLATPDLYCRRSVSPQ